MPLSEKYTEALVWAHELHRDQTRKGSGVPYISHLLAVGAIVIEHGGDEDQAIAGLLHDVIEDQGGKDMHGEIAERFGPRVADIVLSLSDAVTKPKPPWRERKEKAVADVSGADASILLVEAADKLHNARSVLKDYRILGEELWKRFKGGRDGTLWYYRAMADALSAELDTPLAGELQRVVGELERAASRGAE